MDRFDTQKKVFTIVAVFELVAVLALIAAIPRLMQEHATGEIPKAAPIATAVAMGVRLLILLAVLYGIRLSKLKRRINKEINLAAGVVLLLLGLVLMDGAFAYIDQFPFVSIVFFVAVFCDLAAAITSFTAMVLLRKKKKN
jgi:hypothetical protein